MPALQRGAAEGEAVARLELIEQLHQALHSSGVKEGDTHFLLDWIADDFRDEINRWWLRAAGMGLLGFAAGAVTGYLAC